MMSMKKTALTMIFLLMTACLYSSGQEKKSKEKIRKVKDEVVKVIEDTLTNEYLDTLEIKKNLEINDYTMIGVQYGVGLSQVSWNPAQQQDMLIMPVNFGVTYTRYGKMFGYMPYFGFQAGLFYGKEGYQFKYDEEDDYTYKIEGAEKAVMEVVELPVLAHLHFDVWKLKLIANIGCYAGYRLSIERFPGKTGNVSESVAHSFMETDRRFDYGIKGGAGIGLIFDPVEIHFTAMYKHSFSSLYQPDYYSQYYYRYAYPSNIIISAGLHFQLTKRNGKTKSQLKKAAKDIVYGNDKSTDR